MKSAWSATHPRLESDHTNGLSESVRASPSWILPVPLDRVAGLRRERRDVGVGDLLHGSLVS